MPPDSPPSRDTCPLCLDVLLRPVVPECGHAACRSCYLAFVESSLVRRQVRRSGKLCCPACRCEMAPMVPQVDDALANRLSELYALRIAERNAAVSLTEAEEEDRAAAYNLNPLGRGEEPRKRRPITSDNLCLAVLLVGLVVTSFANVIFFGFPP